MVEASPAPAGGGGAASLPLARSRMVTGPWPPLDLAIVLHQQEAGRPPPCSGRLALGRAVAREAAGQLGPVHGAHAAPGPWRAPRERGRDPVAFATSNFSFSGRLTTFRLSPWV